jgi:3-deoxy-D-manno-octulosonic-acid transferase
MKVARDELPDGFEVYYLPMECTLAIRRAFRRINPGMIVLIETELWPNLVHHALERKTPIAIVNGRLSDKSFAKYRSLRSLFEPLLGAISYIHTQSEKDAQKFAALGASPSRIHSGGNIKVSGMISNLAGFNRQRVLKELHLRDDVRYVVFGSTRPGEEELALDAFDRVRIGHPDVKAILAPRHTVRVEEIEKIISSRGLKCLRRSAMADDCQDYDVMILDTMGELWKVYGIAECAFVGGSLVPIGGHNPLEPIALGVPTCFGSHMGNCIDLASKCIEHGMATTVHDGDELARFLDDCLNGKVLKPESVRFSSIFSSDLGEVTERLRSLWR